MATYYKLIGCLTWVVMQNIASSLPHIKPEIRRHLVLSKAFTFSIFNVCKNFLTSKKKSRQVGKLLCNVISQNLKWFSLMMALFSPEESSTQEEYKKRSKSNKKKTRSSMTEVVQNITGLLLERLLKEVALEAGHLKTVRKRM